MGEGVLKAKFLEEMYENKLEFPGGGGVQNKNLPRWGSMTIFWNCTLHTKTYPPSVTMLQVMYRLLSSSLLCKLQPLQHILLTPKYLD